VIISTATVQRGTDMEIDYFLARSTPNTVAEKASLVEGRGHDKLWIAESGNDVLSMSLLVAQGTKRLGVGTCAALAFARSPMATAYTAWDIAQYSGGRFTLGLAAGTREQIEGRFSMPWGSPVSRMEEYVLALRTIWQSWRDESPLAFEGRWYHHTSMERAYRPQVHELKIPVVVAAVGPKMIAAAARVADGLLLHPLTTRVALKESILPIIEHNLKATGRNKRDFNVILPLMATLRGDDPASEASELAVKNQLAWYGVRPQYDPLLVVAGFPSLGNSLRELAQANEWSARKSLIDDDVIEAFTIRGEPHELADLIQGRFGGLVDRVALYFDILEPMPDVERRFMGALRQPSTDSR
jgi:probable F420-dependent oxidoreductase